MRLHYELRTGEGSRFFVHNRVGEIDSLRILIYEALVPDCVGVARQSHGQWMVKKLEKIMVDFYQS